MPGLDQYRGEVCGGDMVIVRAVIDRCLPIQRLDPLHRTDSLSPGVQPVECHIQAPSGVSQIFFQRRRA